MKKPCKEGRTDLSTGSKILSVLFTALFLCGEIFPQIPINGFCRFNSFRADSGFGSLFTLNYNNDSYTDLLLYNPARRTVASLTGAKNGGFEKLRAYPLPLAVTALQNVSEIKSKAKKFAVISRPEREAGIISFTPKGRPYLTSRIKFDSYPENISCADVDGDGTDEILLSGPAFNGLSILKMSKKKLADKKIVSNTSFYDAVFVDLTNDGQSDIAASDVVRDSLFFYYNMGGGSFEKVRSIPAPGAVCCLKAADMNLDNYQDLVFAAGKSINIIYGDSASSYSRNVKINTEFVPDKIIIGDFNRDGKMDIAYLNKKEGELSVIFAKSELGFYPEINYMKKPGLSDAVPFYSRFINGIAAIDGKGNVYILSNLPSVSENVNIAVTSDPGAINYFDDGNNGINDICYIDNSSNTLNLLVRNNAGIPSLLYTARLFRSHKSILPDNVSAKKKIFFCYTRGEKLIEEISADLGTNELKRRTIYSPGKILDVKISKNEMGYNQLNIAYTDNDGLGLSIIGFNGYRYTYTNYAGASPGVTGVSISAVQPPSLFYWKREDDSMTLYRTSFGEGGSNTKLLISVPVKDEASVRSFTGELLNNYKDATVSFISAGGITRAVFSNANHSALLKNKNLPNIAETTGHPFFFGEVKPNGLKKLCFYNSSQGIIEKLDFTGKGRSLAVTELAGVNSASDYFIKNMNFKNYHLVYSNSTNNCITIRQIN